RSSRTRADERRGFTEKRDELAHPHYESNAVEHHDGARETEVRGDVRARPARIVEAKLRDEPGAPEEGESLLESDQPGRGRERSQSIAITPRENALYGEVGDAEWIPGERIAERGERDLRAVADGDTDLWNDEIRRYV